MPSFLYRCPKTGKDVEGFVPDEPSHDRRFDDDFEVIVCNECKGLHWVDTKTGKVLGAKEE